MRHTLLIVLLAVVGLPNAVAQNGGEGSIYSRFGVGQLVPRYSSKASALGGGALAYSSASFVNLSNPASLSDQVLVRFSGGLRFEGVETTDALDVQSKLSYSNFDGIAIGVPLLANQLGLGLGFSKVSQVGYRIDVVKPLNLGDQVDSGESVGARFQGNGGLNQVNLGLGYRISRRLSVGVRGDFVFGIIEEVQETVFNDTRFQDTRLVRSTRMRGLSGGVSARVSLPSILRQGDFLNLAVALDLPNSLETTRLVSEGSGPGADTLTTPVKGSTDLPLSVSVGLLYQPSAKLSWNVDFLFEPWSDFSSELSFPGYSPGGSSTLSDRSRISTGIEYFPAGRDLLASFFSRSAYRFGVFRESGYVSPSASKRVDSFGISSGISLPTVRGGTRIDINLDVGARGAAEGSLVRDRYIRIGLHFNFAERWFARSQLG
ncbi:MAG: hypothetical protein ACI80V_001890 [Rhodothermales bacterium]|jgi:hypothetical protein